MNIFTNMFMFIFANFIINVVSKTQHRLKGYAIAALLGFLSIISVNNLFGNDMNYIRELHDNEIRIVLKHLNPKDLTHEQRRFYMEKMDFHEFHAQRTYEDAKERCWWLPNIDDREKARYCFNAIAALCAPGTLQSKIMRALIVLLTQYGLDCMDEWEYINNKLYWSEYHWDMYEFYANVLVNG